MRSAPSEGAVSAARIRHSRDTHAVRSVLRVAVIGVGVITGMCGALFAVSWIDTGEDSTCASVVYPDLWWSHVSACRGIMLVRTGISVAMIGTGVALVWIGIGRRHRSTAASLAVGLSTLVVVALAMWINEIVRSGGAL